MFFLLFYCMFYFHLSDEENSGIIPVQHLSDFPDLAPFLLNTYSVGDTLTANCYSLDNTWAVFTMKRSLMQYFKVIISIVIISVHNVY